MPSSIKSPVAAYALTFIFTLSATVAVYINSNFLAQFWSAGAVAGLFAGGAALGLASLPLAYWGIRRWGNARVMRGTLAACLLGAVTCAIAPGPWSAAAGFLVAFAGIVVGNFQIDIFLQTTSRHAETGTTRGWYLTAMNFAFLLGPLIVSVAMTDHQFWRAFAISALLIVAAYAFFRRHFRGFEDPIYEVSSLRQSVARVWCAPDLRRAFACFGVLQLFYVWMVLYVPLHLVQTAGFPVHEVALMMVIALVPFLVLQEWLGKLADCCTGEKEFLTAGLAIMGISLLALAAIDGGGFAVWATALFATRVGAAMVESMSYSYIFRRVDAAQADLMELFHAARPAATLVGPLAAMPLLLWAGIPSLFVALALVCFAAILYARPLRDSR